MEINQILSDISELSNLYFEKSKINKTQFIRGKYIYKIERIEQQKKG